MQTNDWWTGVGLQWYVDATNSGWAFSWSDGVIRSSGFISEPFYYQFVDFTGASGSMQPPLPPPHGLRLWNQNAIAVKTDGKIKPNDPFNAANNIVDRGFLAPEVQAVVTVGLEGVHPIGHDQANEGALDERAGAATFGLGCGADLQGWPQRDGDHDGERIAVHMARAETGTGKFSGLGRRSDGPGRCAYCVAEREWCAWTDD